MRHIKEAFGTNVCGYMQYPIIKKEFDRIFYNVIKEQQIDSINVGLKNKSDYINANDIIFI